MLLIILKHQSLIEYRYHFDLTIDRKIYYVIYYYQRALATLYVCRNGTVYSDFGGFDTPESHIRHAQKLKYSLKKEASYFSYRRSAILYYLHDCVNS